MWLPSILATQLENWSNDCKQDRRSASDVGNAINCGASKSFMAMAVSLTITHTVETATPNRFATAR